MKKKQKRNLRISLIVLSLLLTFVFLFVFIIPTNNSLTTTPSTTTGSNGGTVVPSTDVPAFKFPTFDFNFTMPCFWNCGEPESTFDESNLDDFTKESCRIDADCANTCSNPTYAKCTSGDCSCTVPTIEVPTCFDSDLSLVTRTLSVYEILGTTKSSADRGEFTDYCSRGNLIEYSCRNGLVFSTVIDCKGILDEYASCYNGECVTLQ